MYDLLLANVSRFIQLSPEEIKIFTSCFKPRSFRKRQYVVQAGDVARYESFVIKGCLRGYYVDQAGVEHIVQFAIEDWWTSDLKSFLTGEPAVFNIEALEDCELLQIDLQTLEDLYLRVPKLERFFRILFQKSMLAMQDRILSSISKTAQEKYLDFVKRYPSVEQRVPQYMIASYLGITPEFLSKIRKQMAEGH